MRMNSTYFVVILALACSAACGNDHPSITQPSPTQPPTTPSATLTSTSVTGVTPMMTGTATQFHNIARYSDGTTRDVTSESNWSSSAPPFATVDAAGIVTAIKPGDLQINASYQNTNGSMRISVMPPAGTPWSQLPPLSQAAKDFIVAFNIDKYGAVTRWTDSSISVYADPGFPRQSVVDATQLWTSTSGGKLVFTITDNQASARIVLTFSNNLPPEAICGVEGPSMTSISNFVITSGHGEYRNTQACAGGDQWKVGLAHGIGHILGLGGHTAPSTDLMSSAGPFWQMSSLLSEIINWLYSVPPGTRPI